MLKYKKQKKKIIMRLRKITNMAMCFVIMLIVSACSQKSNNDEISPHFVGIAIFQSSTENTKWNTIRQDTSLINNIIETKDDKIMHSDDPAFLFFVYAQKLIDINTKDSDFISNTTRDQVLITNNTISFTLERIAEKTDVLIYFVYKNNDGYYLKFIKEQNNISEESKTITIDTNTSNFNTIEINLKTNLSTKKEY